MRSLHDETVRSWHTERAASGQQLQELQAAVEQLRQVLQQRAAAADQASQRALLTVTELTVERETLHKKLDRSVSARLLVHLYFLLTGWKIPSISGFPLTDTTSGSGKFPTEASA